MFWDFLKNILKSPEPEKPLESETFLKVGKPVKYYEVGAELVGGYKAKSEIVGKLMKMSDVVHWSVPIFDAYYALYPKEVIFKQELLIPSRYDLRPDNSYYKIRKEDIKTNDTGDFWDCDNNARELAYWYSLLLPGIACFNIHGKKNGTRAHAFIGILTKERELLWRNIGGVAPHFEDARPDYDTLYDIWM